MPPRIRIAIVGLGFGAEFIPIYQRHPDAEMAAICQRNPAQLTAAARAFKIAKATTRFQDLLEDSEIDAIHINTPIPDHAPMTLAALAAGKHVACTVPMATSVADCLAILDLSRSSGRKYMMMETVVYSREFLFVQDLYRSGAMGRLQFLRASHQQEMSGWPGYWEGLPPMWYATHCVSPCLALTGALADSVVCHGSGRIEPKLEAKYGSPFAVETATIKIRERDVVAEVTRSLFNTARQYRESFDAYAEKVSFEWPQVEHERPLLHRGEKVERLPIPDYSDRLPAPIRRYTTHGVYDDQANTHLSFKQGSGHGGSHPHMAHEFLRSIVEDRHAIPNAETAANWTMTGLLAHESALRGGERMTLPRL